MKIRNISGLVIVTSVLVSEVVAAPAPVIITVYETQGVAPTAQAPAAAASYAPVANVPAPVAQPASAPVAPAVAPAVAPVAANPTPAYSDSSALDNLFSKILSYFGIGSSGSSSYSAPSVTTTSTASVIPYFAPASSKASTPVATYAPYAPPAKSSTSDTSPQSTASSTSSSGSSSGVSLGLTEDPAFAQDILDAHNKYRALHGAGPLTWDTSAYQYAQNNANNYDCSGVLTHTHGQYGENLAAGFSSGSSAVQAWYDEGQTYDYAASNSYDHFTQVVWKGSTKLGCAWKDCTAQNWGHYVICEYDPPGNVVGQSRANVLPN
jgi:uncharacterized protein YkwD